ncbi:MAG: hypothetical protein GY753_03635 [Gammaproteobacteria bacterium]|nr:hypothetical protein [Gammaproteobacteria bacterium]
MPAEPGQSWSTRLYEVDPFIFHTVVVGFMTIIEEAPVVRNYIRRQEDDDCRIEQLDLY